MKAIFAAVFLLLSLASGQINTRDSCPQDQHFDDSPRRLVIIQGKATIDLPDEGPLPATSESLIFKKVGCNSCFVAATVDIDGNYKIHVADGKYKIIVRNPSSPDFDMLMPDQERFIDTETAYARMHSQQVFKFDIRIRTPK